MGGSQSGSQLLSPGLAQRLRTLAPTSPPGRPTILLVEFVFDSANGLRVRDGAIQLLLSAGARMITS
jgi:hypothetical protein